ncbi:MAG: serine/threonine-protein kinase [Dehalococcoidia bacterium]
MTSPNNQPLAIVGPYELIERVGAGGMGSVYRARNVRDGQQVALKLMHEHVASDPSYAERFRREAAVAALIDSPNVVRVLEFASDRGRPYIVTEYVEGRSLEEILQEGPLSAERSASIAAGVANALAAAGSRNVVHRDIKPANILISVDGTAKVTDFGIATLNQNSSLTIPGMFVGTAAYASPEQHHGVADIRSDIYSLGVVLFELVTGTPPFTANSATDMLRQHESGRVPVELLQGQPPRLAEAITRCLEKSPERRYQSPQELASDLVDSLPEPAAPSSDNRTVVVAAPSETVVAAPLFAPNAGDMDDGTTRIGAGLMETGEHTVVGAPGASLSPVVADFRERVRSTPLLTRALGAAAAIGVVTMVALFGVRGGHGQEPPATGGSGGGSSVQLVDFGQETPSPEATETATATVPPKKQHPGVIETPGVSPTATSTPSATPTQAPPTTTPPPPAPPAPVLQVTDWVFCHQVGCPYGDEYLEAGYPIAIGFQFNQLTNQPVSVEIWFDGEYQYTSNFTASSNGLYYDVLPYANYAGELELDIYVGGSYLTSLYADVN